MWFWKHCSSRMLVVLDFKCNLHSLFTLPCPDNVWTSVAVKDFRVNLLLVDSWRPLAWKCFFSRSLFSDLSSRRPRIATSNLTFNPCSSLVFCCVHHDCLHGKSYCKTLVDNVCHFVRLHLFYWVVFSFAQFCTVLHKCLPTIKCWKLVCVHAI